MKPKNPVQNQRSSTKEIATYSGPIGLFPSIRVLNSILSLVTFPVSIVQKCALLVQIDHGHKNIGGFGPLL